jgi:hypothetical protein
MKIFDDLPKGHVARVRLHYGDPERAKESIMRLRREPIGYQYRAARTMYGRAKYHAQQTDGMRKSMKLYGNFLRSLRQTKKRVKKE